MKVTNLLEFLNKTKRLYTLDYAVCNSELVDYLDIISIEEEFTKKIDLGLIYIAEITNKKCGIIDGLNRLLSLSLLLHAICECYKKTSERNDKAISTIRRKYLLDNSQTKLCLPEEMQKIYEKIIYGERLSGKEKGHPMFILLHNYWQEIKNNGLKASQIFGMLQKITVTLVDVENVENRDLYYSINHETKNLNQILLIDDFLNKPKTKDIWKDIKTLYRDNNSDLILFFRDFFWNKFNFKSFNENRLYEYFVNYFQTMLQYSKPNEIMQKMKRSAELYYQLLNVEISNVELKNAIIQLKLHNCEDTYAYLLSVYEDYTDGSLSLATFLEILSAIQEYLESREKNENNVGFNELIQYLNAFIAYK